MPSTTSSTTITSTQSPSLPFCSGKMNCLSAATRIRSSTTRSSRRPQTPTRFVPAARHRPMDARRDGLFPTPAQEVASLTLAPTMTDAINAAAPVLAPLVLNVTSHSVAISSMRPVATFARTSTTMECACWDGCSTTILGSAAPAGPMSTRLVSRSPLAKVNTRTFAQILLCKDLADEAFGNRDCCLLPYGLRLNPSPGKCPCLSL